MLTCVAIIYFVNPFDLIPDLAPVAGYIDDAFVIAAVAAQVVADLEAFRGWEQSRATATLG